MSFLAGIGRVTRLTIISTVLGSLGLPLAALQVAHAAPPIDLAATYRRIPRDGIILRHTAMGARAAPKRKGCN